MSLGPWCPAEIGPTWRQVVGDELWAAWPRSWQPEYDEGARDGLDQLLSRAMDGMTGYGRLSLEECRRDAVVSLRRLDPMELSQRGDHRYSSEGMATFLRKNRGLDLVPITCGSRAGAPWVLDGHHRLRAYILAGRAPLAYCCFLTKGGGAIRVGQ